ncbi:hypothetical protein ACFRI7_18310 [Streptomyces sp. NPDC056716]|uniref:hypothetical protein n=1 Tax=unclassified Streptomyces TaxID=2593676 RepID=UPI0036C52154
MASVPVSPSVAESLTPSPVISSTAPEATEPATPVEEEFVPEEPAGAAALWGMEYAGTAQVTVDVYDYCTNGGSRTPGRTP